MNERVAWAWSCLVHYNVIFHNISEMLSKLCSFFYKKNFSCMSGFNAYFAFRAMQHHSGVWNEVMVLLTSDILAGAQLSSDEDTSRDLGGEKRGLYRNYEIYGKEIIYKGGCENFYLCGRFSFCICSLISLFVNVWHWSVCVINVNLHLSSFCCPTVLRMWKYWTITTQLSATD